MGVEEFRIDSNTIFRVYIFGLISKNMCLVVLPRKGIGIRIEQ